MERAYIIYLAGPISKTNDAEERFADAEAFFREELKSNDGKYPTIINPERAFREIAKVMTQEELMDVCISTLRKADVIVMMNGWEQSVGACQELGAAKAYDLIIFYEDDFDGREQKG